MELAQGIVVADRFRLVRPLGQGGMGAVWLAQHTGLDVPCAVKFIHEEAAKSEELRARFEREAKAAAQIRSPHVVQILDHGVWRGAPYIAMEFLEGEDLGQRLHRRGALPPRETLAIAVQVGRALAKAHGAGLIHRDLKPANVFLVRDEDREIAKVLDFGVAKVKETGLDGNTKTGAVLGTPYYMSPEQARGSKAIDHRSDLWALAVVVYQCLTGHLPFMGEALGDLFVKIIVEPLPVPSQYAYVPPGFDGWWARAAARDPGHRFQTAKELTDTLGLALGVTLAEGLEVGSAMASVGAMPGGGHGTMAMMTPPGAMPPYAGGPSTPYPGGPSTPYPGGPSTPYPGAQAAPYSGMAMPYPGGPPLPGALTPSGAVMPPAPMPTPLHQAISVHQAPPSGRGGLVAAVLAGAVALGGVGGFLAYRSSLPAARSDPQPPGPAGAGSAEPPAQPSAVPPTSSSATPPTSAAPPEPSAVPVASASVPTPVSAAPRAGATAPAAKAAGGKPPAAPGPRPKTDFGF